MTLLHTTRYFNCGFYYYKYNSVELIFEETKLNKISENKFPLKIIRYTVCVCMYGAPFVPKLYKNTLFIKYSLTYKSAS